VMSVHMASKVSAESRESAAKRSSEGTIEAARLAAKESYVSVPGSKLPVPSRLSEPGTLSLPDIHQPCFNTDTRTEQARLLSLLRSLPPALVVDQLCRALNFFGGKKGPPVYPEEDGFPNSAVGNGPGPLFVSWISEIFPSMEATSATGTPVAPVYTVQPLPHAHLTGASKRSQAEITAVGRVTTSTSQPAAAAPRSTADHGTNEVRVGNRYPGDAFTPKRDCQTVPYEMPPIERPADASVDTSIDQPELTSTATKRPRGRPKGSRNKSKKLATSIPVDSTETDYTPAFELAAGLPENETEPKKRGRGRPKGSRNRPKDSDAPAEASRVTSIVTTGDAGPVSGHTASFVRDELSLRPLDEISSGGTRWTRTISNSGPGDATDVRHCQDMNLDRPRRNDFTGASSSNELPAAVFDQMMADVPVERAPHDPGPSGSKRRRRNGPQDPSRPALGLCEEQNLEEHINDSGDTLSSSHPQHALGLRQSSMSEVYFPVAPWH
jgi:hypothetical protein